MHSQRFTTCFRPGIVLGLTCLLLAGRAFGGEVIDWVDVSGQGGCVRADIHLNVPFQVIGYFPQRPTRFFYVLGQVPSPGTAGDAFSRRRESASPLVRAGSNIREITYLGDIPGPKLLLIQTEVPAIFYLHPQRDPRRVSVWVTPSGMGMECGPNSKQ